MRKELSGTVPEWGLSLFVLVSVLVHAVFFITFSINYAIGRRPAVWLDYKAGDFQLAAVVKTAPAEKITIKKQKYILSGAAQLKNNKNIFSNAGQEIKTPPAAGNQADLISAAVAGAVTDDSLFGDGDFSSGGSVFWRPPEIISTPVLFYPRGAQLAGHNGQVMVVVWLSAEGRPEKSGVEKSSGWPDLDRAALDQALAWRYRPAYWHHNPVASRLIIPVRFVLPEN